MNAQQMNAWIYCGGGLQLWKELYQKFGLIPFPSGNTTKELAQVEIVFVEVKGCKRVIVVFIIESQPIEDVKIERKTLQQHDYLHIKNILKKQN